jgi:hypothetical protein
MYKIGLRKMLKFKLVLILILFSFITVFAQVNSSKIRCFTNVDLQTLKERDSIINTQNVKSINDIKYIRVNIHFMLRSDGTGNFNENNDGAGHNYSGYDFAFDLIDNMNFFNSYNPQLNIPTGNNIPSLDKNYYYVLDAVYYWNNDNTYNFQTINYYNQGKDKDSVINVFFSYDGSNGVNVSGYASSLSQYSKVKYTEIRDVWEYVMAQYNGSYPLWYHPISVTTIHEIGHLLGLSHTVRWNSSSPCPDGCGSPVNYSCDDGCSDTPTAWDIAQANNCSKHPACGWGRGNDLDCSNNLMDYSGDVALSPCQLNIIHTFIENGMNSYTLCKALTSDKQYCTLNYPKISYYGKKVTIGGCTSSIVNSNQKFKVYFNEEVELEPIEINELSEIEFVYYQNCNF